MTKQMSSLSLRMIYQLYCDWVTRALLSVWKLQLYACSDTFQGLCWLWLTHWEFSMSSAVSPQCTVAGKEHRLMQHLIIRHNYCSGWKYCIYTTPRGDFFCTPAPHPPDELIQYVCLCCGVVGYLRTKKLEKSMLLVRETDTRLKKGALSPYYYYYYYYYVRKGAVGPHYYYYLRKGTLGPHYYYYYVRKGAVGPHYYYYVKKGTLGPHYYYYYYVRKGAVGPHYYYYYCYYLRKGALGPHYCYYYLRKGAYWPYY